MRWYITSQSEDKTSTHHCWISDEDNKALMRCMITGERLVTERTCTNCKTGDFWRCSSCGCEILLRHNDWVTLYMGEVNFCPNCGAKVVED